jgi:hypothetical protein
MEAKRISLALTLSMFGVAAEARPVASRYVLIFLVEPKNGNKIKTQRGKGKRTSA